MKQIIKNMPVIGPIARRIYLRCIKLPQPFPGSSNYWKNRYGSGGNSGVGSYDQLAEFKAEILTTFVLESKIVSVIEYGCGDGNQLSLAQYPSYIGFDVSARAVFMCREHFSNDSSKIFKLMEDYEGETAELTLSLDVIYHLVEDDVFVDHMNRLFDSSTRFVIVYSSNTDDNPLGQAAHVRHRRFSEWIEHNKPYFILRRHIPNKYPFNSDTNTGSFADFYVYEKTYLGGETN